MPCFRLDEYQRARNDYRRAKINCPNVYSEVRGSGIRLEARFQAIVETRNMFFLHPDTIERQDEQEERWESNQIGEEVCVSVGDVVFYRSKEE